MSASDLNVRYGRTVNRKRRNLIIAIGFGVIIVVTFALWTIWGGLFVPTASIDTEPIGNIRISANQIEVKWEMSEAPGTKAKCAVQALDQNFGVVGWKILDIPPSNQGSRNLSTIVRTAQPAVSGLINLCWPTKSDIFVVVRVARSHHSIENRQNSPVSPFTPEPVIRVRVTSARAHTRRTMSDTSVTWLTQGAFDRLTAELEQLSGDGRIEIAKKIEAAREEGDLKENGGYHAAKEEQGKIEARIRVLTQLLRTATVGEAPESHGVVEPGTVVTANIQGDKTTFLVGNREMAGGSDLDVYSEASPLGTAIMGLKIGATKTYTAPNGKAITVEILKVETYQP